MNRARRSEGAVLLARTGLSQPAVAASVGCSQPAVAAWMNGDRVPLKKWRRKLRAAYQIPTKAWDEEPNTGDRVTVPVAVKKLPSSFDMAKTESARGDDDVSVFSLALSLSNEVEAQIKASREKGVTPNERMRVLSEAARLLTILGAYTGARMAVDERKILRSPAWKRIEDAVSRALEPHPEAAKAVGEAIMALDKGEHAA